MSHEPESTLSVIVVDASSSSIEDAGGVDLASEILVASQDGFSGFSPDAPIDVELTSSSVPTPVWPTHEGEPILMVDGQQVPIEHVIGTEGENGLRIGKLRGTTGFVTVDPAFVNTASCESYITFIDGEKGILRYRGYPIEQLAEQSHFTEVQRLLLHGELPTRGELQIFDGQLLQHAALDDDLIKAIGSMPQHAHPMAILGASMELLSASHPDLVAPVQSGVERNDTIMKILAKMPTLAAYAYKQSTGQEFVAPRADLDYVDNFLHMMFSTPDQEYEILETVHDVMDMLLILHADHEQNCSTSATKTIASSGANLFASVVGGVNALWGPRHGGANQAVIKMLQDIHEDGGDLQKWIDKAEDKNDPFRLMGFGHRVYKHMDPRALIIKENADRVLKSLGVDDPLLGLAMELEQRALKEEYFQKRKLFPNVDFYSGIIYKAMGIPPEMFTVLFALGRAVGWLGQAKEAIEKDEAITRPRQIYIGEKRKELCAY